MFFFGQFGVDKSEIVEWLTMPAWGSVCFVLTRAIMMHLVFKKSCFVFHINYSCIVYGLVLFFVDLTFFLFSLLPIMVKIPLMSHSSVPFSHTRTNCDRVRNIKFLTSHLHLLVDTARSTDRACGRKLLEWHLP